MYKFVITESKIRSYYLYDYSQSHFSQLLSTRYVFRCAIKIKFSVCNFTIVGIPLLSDESVPIPFLNARLAQTFQNLDVSAFGVFDHHANVVVLRARYHSLHFWSDIFTSEEQNISCLHLRFELG